MSGTRRTRHPAIDAALRTAAVLTGMELVFVGRIEDTDFIFAEVHGELPGCTEGARWPMDYTLCQQMLAGAPRATSCAATEPAYRDVPGRSVLGVSSYVGVPIYAATGEVLGTLCGIDRGEVAVDDAVLGVLDELAGIVARHIDPAQAGTDAGEVVVRRTATGWVVDDGSAQAGPGEETDSLVAAMALADLLARDLPAAARPARVEGELTDADRLALTVHQLEHALTARVVVEQAIGVLSERLRIAPRSAFERLRKAARSRGRRVHDLAADVVASATDAAVPLPPELHGRAR